MRLGFFDTNGNEAMPILARTTNESRSFVRRWQHVSILAQHEAIQIALYVLDRATQRFDKISDARRVQCRKRSLKRNIPRQAADRHRAPAEDGLWLNDSRSLPRRVLNENGRMAECGVDTSSRTYFTAF